MRKIISILFCVFTVIITGCTSDLALKEKCANYISTAQGEVEKANAARYGDYSVTTSFDGVLYSKKLNTCVAIIKTYNSTLKNAGINPLSVSYKDMLTGQYINEIDETSSSDTNFLQKLDLTK